MRQGTEFVLWFHPFVIYLQWSSCLHFVYCMDSIYLLILFSFLIILQQILEAHDDEVWFVQFSHNGKYLASASNDRTAIIWEVIFDIDLIIYTFSFLLFHSFFYFLLNLSSILVFDLAIILQIQIPVIMFSIIFQTPCGSRHKNCILTRKIV